MKIEALQMPDRQDWADEERLQELRAAIQLGVNDIEAGRFTVIETEDDLNEMFRP